MSFMEKLYFTRAPHKRKKKTKVNKQYKLVTWFSLKTKLDTLTHFTKPGYGPPWSWTCARRHILNHLNVIKAWISILKANNRTKTLDKRWQMKSLHAYNQLPLPNLVCLGEWPPMWYKQLWPGCLDNKCTRRNGGRVLWPDGMMSHAPFFWGKKQLY
jgi:hypothetical protein